MSLVCPDWVNCRSAEIVFDWSAFDFSETVQMVEVDVQLVGVITTPGGGCDMPA